VLREEFLLPMGLSAHAFVCGAACAGRVNDIVRGRRGVTADTALRLARYFGTSAEFWMGLQSDHEMAVACTELADALASITPRQPLAA